MKVSELFKLLEDYCGWSGGDSYEDDFEVRIVQLEDEETGELLPLYEIEAETEYGSYDTMYLWPNGYPTWLSQNSDVNLEEYNVRDREGILLTQEEYDKLYRAKVI